MGQLVAVMVASGVVGLMALPMMQLALLPVQASKQKSSFALAEANAIEVRKQAASSNSLGDLTIPSGCTQKSNERPRGEAAIVANYVECTVGEGKAQAVAWQPLYTLDDLQSSGAGQDLDDQQAGEVCYSLYRQYGQAKNDGNKIAANGQTYFWGGTSDIAALLSTSYVTVNNNNGNGGNNGGSDNPQFFLRIHDSAANSCQSANRTQKPSQLTNPSA